MRCSTRSALLKCKRVRCVDQTSSTDAWVAVLFNLEHSTAAVVGRGHKEMLCVTPDRRTDIQPEIIGMRMRPTV